MNKLSRKKIYKLIITVLAITCFIGVLTGVIVGESRGPPTRTAFTSSDTRTEFVPGRMYDMGDVLYMRRGKSTWDVESDNPRIDGKMIIFIDGFLKKSNPPMPENLWGRYYYTDDNGKTTWRGSWHTYYHDDGSAVVIFDGYGAGPNIGLRLEGQSITAYNDGQMVSTTEGHIIDPYGRS